MPISLKSVVFSTQKEDMASNNNAVAGSSVPKKCKLLIKNTKKFTVEKLKMILLATDSEWEDRGNKFIPGKVETSIDEGYTILQYFWSFPM